MANPFGNLSIDNHWFCLQVCTKLYGSSMFTAAFCARASTVRIAIFKVLPETVEYYYLMLSARVPTRTDLSLQVRKNPFLYGFLHGFFQKYGFLDFCTDYFLRDHFYRLYSLILLFCKLCECDAICCELCDDKYQKHLVSILSILLLQSIDTIDSIDTFFLFFLCKVAIQNDG